MPVTQRGEEPPAVLLESPPPYYGQSTPDPAKSQGYQCPVRGAAEGELTGKIQLTWTATQQDTNDVDRESFLSDRVSAATESTDREITQLESVVHQDSQGQSKRTQMQHFSKPVAGSSPAGVATSVSSRGKYEEAVSEEVARMKKREQYLEAQRKCEYGRREERLYAELRAQPSKPPVVGKKVLLRSQSLEEEPYDMRANHHMESPYAQKGHQRGMKELEELEMEMNKLENLEREVANTMESLAETRQTLQSTPNSGPQRLRMQLEGNTVGHGQLVHFLCHQEIVETSGEKNISSRMRHAKGKSSLVLWAEQQKAQDLEASAVCEMFKVSRQGWQIDYTLGLGQLFMPFAYLLHTQWEDISRSSSSSSKPSSTDDGICETNSTYLSDQQSEGDWVPPNPFPNLFTPRVLGSPPGVLNPPSTPPVAPTMASVPP
ncbi:hypothetical protein GBF38_001869 [Nibea albiflora]|uniref:Uncharacterized protein n=1 Tax=Nibea albiflora TaxID=240163 RepID=A0ACB7EDC8_NIBAL|nr:hypothetical protein GBF38_001869 [Nibea albiflora]